MHSNIKAAWVGVGGTFAIAAASGLAWVAVTHPTAYKQNFFWPISIATIFAGACFTVWIVAVLTCTYVIEHQIQQNENADGHEHIRTSALVAVQHRLRRLQPPFWLIGVLLFIGCGNVFLLLLPSLLR